MDASSWATRVRPGIRSTVFFTFPMFHTTVAHQNYYCDHVGVGGSSNLAFASVRSIVNGRNWVKAF